MVLKRKVRKMINLSNYINQVKKILDEKVNLLKLKNELLKVD